MDTQLLITFREVAKWQNFTRAAEELGYAQSSVTTQIQNLETEFDAKLFERWGRKIRLTPAGEQLLGYTEKILSLLEEAKITISADSEVTGTITIGTVESMAAFFLPPYVKQFRKEHPRMKILLKPGICSQLRQGVRDGEFDLAIIMDWPQYHPDLVVIPLREEEMVLISAPDHPMTKLSRVEGKDFVGETLIVTEEGCSYRLMLESVLRDAGVVPETALEFGSLEAIKQCVANGLGIALLPKVAVAEEIRSGKLAVLPFRHKDIRVFTQLVYHKKKWMTQALSRFIELLTKEAEDVQDRYGVVR